MLTFLLASIALAGDPAALTIDAKVPAEVRLDGHIVGQLFMPGRLELSVSPGDHHLAIIREGKPEELPVRVPESGAVVIIGKTGTTLGAMPVDKPDADGPIELEIRVSGDAPVQLRLANQRFDLAPGRVVRVELPPGPHNYSFRNRNGTLVWARGTLELQSGTVVLQLSEGRAPELSGDARFYDGSD